MVAFGKLLCIAAPAFAFGNELHRVTLNKRERSFDEWKTYLTARHQKLEARAAANSSAPNGYPEPIHDFQDLSYTGSIMAGTPGVLEEVVFDTGSSNLWVPNTQPSGMQKHIYDHTKSSTYVADGRKFNIQYGSGPVGGYLAKDSFSWGGLTLKNFAFAEINDVTGLGGAYSGSPMDGILGMAFSSISVDGLPAPMEALVKSGVLAEPTFAFYLGGGTNGVNSELVFGGVDEKHYTGDFTYVDLNAETYWQVKNKDLKVGGTSIWSSVSLAGNAIVDSGTSLLAGPVNDVTAIMTQLGATIDRQQGLYSFSCSKMAAAPLVTFELGGGFFSHGSNFDLSVEDLVLERQGDECLLGVQPSPEPLWILGDVFMRKFYVQFDWGKQRMGFATAVRSAELPIVV